MVKNNWPVTFSIGVATFVKAENSVDYVLSKADKLMYIVKTKVLLFNPNIRIHVVCR